jgi:hypothetical protein
VVWQRLAIRNGVNAVRHGRVFVKHVVPAVMKPARTLWNEVIGFIFFCIAVMFGSRTVRLYLDYAAASPADKGTTMGRLVLATFCTLLMVWFGFTSFMRARRISRS